MKFGLEENMIKPLSEMVKRGIHRRGLEVGQEMKSEEIRLDIVDFGQRALQYEPWIFEWWIRVQLIRVTSVDWEYSSASNPRSELGGVLLVLSLSPVLGPCVLLVEARSHDPNVWSLTLETFFLIHNIFKSTVTHLRFHLLLPLRAPQKRECKSPSDSFGDTLQIQCPLIRFDNPRQSTT